MEKWEAWIREAAHYLKAAIVLQEKGFYDISYHLALIAGELGLKAVLTRCGKFSEEDKTHNMLKLFEKIEKESCLPDEILMEIDPIFSPSQGHGLSHVDIAYANAPFSQPQQIFDCEASMTSAIRYPKDSIPPFKYIGYDDAEEKINLSNQLISILLNHFGIKHF